MDNEKIKVIEYYTNNIFNIDYVKNYLRIDNNFDDDFLKNSIITANNFAERSINKTICLKEYKLSFYTKNNIKNLKKLDLIMPLPVVEINEVLIDDNVILSENFEIKNGKIIFSCDISGKIEIIFKAGLYGDEISEDIKQAMLFHIASIYQNKGGNCSIPQASKDIYNIYRDIKI